MNIWKMLITFSIIFSLGFVITKKRLEKKVIGYDHSEEIQWKWDKLPINLIIEDSYMKEEYKEEVEKVVKSYNDLSLSLLQTEIFKIHWYYYGQKNEAKVRTQYNIFSDPLGHTSSEPTPQIVIYENIEYQQSQNESKKRLNSKLFQKIFAHELGHLLGIPHTKDETSLMYFNIHSNYKDELHNDKFIRKTLIFLYKSKNSNIEKLKIL